MNPWEKEKEDAEIDAAETTSNGENAKTKKTKKKKKVSSNDAKKRGVCYLSRIPPHMDHVKLRHLLSQFGDIQRIFLAPQGLSLSNFVRITLFIWSKLDFSV